MLMEKDSKLDHILGLMSIYQHLMQTKVRLLLLLLSFLLSSFEINI